MLSTICGTFSQYVEDRLHGHIGASEESANSLLSLLDVFLAHGSGLSALPLESAIKLLGDVFMYAYIVPISEPPASAPGPARQQRT